MDPAPSPPSRSHHQAELLIPLGLLAFSLLSGVYRYFFVLRANSQYQPLLSSGTQEDEDQTARRPRATWLGKALWGLNHVIVLSFVGTLTVVCLRAIIDKVWSGTFMVLYNVISIVAFTSNLVLMLIEVRKGGQWSWANYSFWWLALAGESFIAWYHLDGVIVPSLNGSTAPVERHDLLFDRALTVLFGLRYTLLWTTAILGLVHWRQDAKEDDLEAHGALDEESAAPSAVFGASAAAPSYGGTYGTFREAFSTPKPDHKPASGLGSSDAEIQKKLDAEMAERASAFNNFWPKIKRLLPFVIPRNDRWLQFLIFLTFVFIAIGRAINVAVPLLTGLIVRELSVKQFNIGSILLFVFARYLQGSSGIVNSARQWSWIPIEQYSNSSLTVRFFEHVHNLSLQFHLNRKTGELLRILDRGTSSIVSLLGTVLFQLVPVVSDVTIAVVVFCYYWSWKYGLIIFLTIGFYLMVTVMMTEWRTRFRRAMISFDNDARAKAVDSLLNFETVKYYSNEGFEISRYREAIKKYMVADYKSQITYIMLNLAQSFVITMGMLAGCLLCAYEIANGDREVDAFVMYMTYLAQLHQPLNWFGSYYRMLQQNFVDMEKMIKLLDQNQSVKDIPNAKKLIVSSGEVVFEDVCFQYDARQKGLQNVSFRVPKGKTVALVGPTGSGKSTILRLLFRFYDVTSGKIYIDGQDISTTTQSSLREQIGVVPQDSVLFNDSIYYNINYGRINATKDEVEDAARAAQIHDKIQDFPDGYETKVGERGLRLSGGEKQRVAIARTILKNPPIVLLDEATSALDSTTESQIQAALARMTENRTTLVVAHRLSTIVNADLILCIKNGVVVEQGTHLELVEKALQNGGQGTYYEMWKQQIREEHGDDSTTVDGHSDTESRGKGKGKNRKNEDSAITHVAQGVSPALSTADSTELIQVVAEEDEKDAPAQQDGTNPESSTSSESSSSKNRKKKSNKKK
ncbi:ATP-binding cassette, subfamily B (MDR/TAP), member 6 [Entomortierella parvispora]|uniref:ATP-binding cassette, subfamily B (MDR/TAP), member 6 n=1 Tax=Entomortierella parvispora TaxID=205924 RepID=A0A9P3LTR8_9FUNG|nr:ATP-binding cassette, subfamily B (MDR/TAP), member 6 [Entomortierella parvispora]